MPVTKGSKKKNVAAAAAAVAVVAAAVEPIVEPTVEQVTEVVEVAAVTALKKKASKKPVKVVAIVTPNGIEGSFHSEPRRPLIVHLGIRPTDIEFSGSVVGAGVEPEPYDASAGDVFAGDKDFITEKPQEVHMSTTVATAAYTTQVQEPVDTVRSMPCFTKSNLMVQFRDSQEEKCLPETIDIACFWCAHRFDHQPCVIPEREVHGVYNVYGNFCAPECGVAYLLREGIDPHVRWERMALLHRIYDREGKGQIFPAPAREALTLFGGPMSIETFRATMRERKVRVDLHMPPMVSILGSIDTKPIDFFDTNLKQMGPNGTMLLPQRSVEEGLRLKRSKPLKDKESTLDTVMNIKIGTQSRRGFGSTAS